MRIRRLHVLLCLALVLLAGPPPAHAESPEEIATIANAAERGNQGAQLLPGLIYRDGRGVARDAAKARYWFDRAAESGYKPVMKSLAHIYKKGLLGVEPDAERAAYWAAHAR